MKRGGQSVFGGAALGAEFSGFCSNYELIHWLKERKSKRYSEKYDDEGVKKKPNSLWIQFRPKLHFQASLLNKPLPLPVTTQQLLHSLSLLSIYHLHACVPGRTASAHSISPHPSGPMGHVHLNNNARRQGQRCSPRHASTGCPWLPQAFLGRHGMECQAERRDVA